MMSFRRSRPAQDALLLANANLENARHSPHDRKQALKYCKAAKKELRRIDISESLVYLDQIIAAYRDHGGVLEKLGSRDDAMKSYNKADKLKQHLLTVPPPPPKALVIAKPLPPTPNNDVPIHGSVLVSPVFPIVDQTPRSFPSTDALTGYSPDHPKSQSTNQSMSLSPASDTLYGYNLELVPASIFAKDFHPRRFNGTLPKPDEDLTDTCQLAYCLSLLRASPFPDGSLDEPTRAWLHNTMDNKDEQERLKNMATDLLLGFMRDGLKDEKTTAEIACIAPVLESNNFRALLGIFVASLKDSALLHVHALEGLDSVIKCATPGSMDPDDLIKILDYLNSCLQGTHIHSLDHVYRLTRTVSYILDTMVDGDIKDLDRAKLHTPLLLYSEKLKRSSDPYMVFQAAYAFQALLRVPNDEEPWQTVLRHTGTVTKGTARIFSSAKGLNVGEFIDTIQGGLEVAVRIFGAVGDAYKDFSALKKSGQDLLVALKSSFNCKRDWYPMLRGIDTLLQSGELAKVKTMICNAPCRRELAFQWGVCQRLGSLAGDPIWDADTQEGAVAFLGEIYRNDAVWGQEAKVKQCIIDILMQLASTSGNAKSAANLLLREFADDDDVRKRTFYDACRKEGPSPHLWKVTSPLLSSSPLLDCVQKTPSVEAELRKLRRVRLQELGHTIYIAPEAKANRQAADHDLFDLTTKVNEFLGSDMKVLLLWGDSGAGKSTFNKELERELWNDYNNCEDRILKKQKKIPIFVSLPAIDKPEPDLIGRQLRNSHFTKAQIQELKAHRKFVLICDGYDEYQQRRNFYDINQLNRPGQWSAQMVISCRSEYLGNDYRYLFQPEDRNGQMGEALFQEAVIAPFSKKRIQTYIEKYVANEAPQWEVKDYLQVFDQFPSLQELVTNPFLLTLSLRVLPNMADLGRNLPSTKVTRIVLYDRFVEQWVDQGKRRLIKRGLVGDDKKAFDILSDDSFSQNAILFVKKLAVAIFENQDGAPVVEYSDQEKGTWKADFFGQDDGKKFLREACPLHRYGNQYRFNHKSLLEYCLARAVFEPQQRGEHRTKGQETPAPERRHEYQGVEKENSVSESASDVKSPLFWKSFVNKPAVLQFLAERVPQEPVFKRQLHSFIEYSKTDKKWCTAAANAITILIRAGVRFNGEELEGIKIPGADLSGGLFDSAQLQGADLRNVSLRNVWLHQADLSNARMSGVQFGEWPYLKEESEVHSCAYSPDGRTYTVGLFNGGLSVYDATSWQKIHTFQGYTDNIDSARSVAYSPSGHQIASGGRDFTVQLWDTESYTPGPILRGHTDRINSITYSPRGYQIASGGRDFTVRLWDVQTGVPGLILRGHSETVTSVAYSPSGRQIASGSRDRTVRLWNAQTGESGPILNGHTNIVTSVEYSPSGHQIATGSRDRTVRLWSTQTGLYGFTLRGHTDIISNVTYSPSGHQIASGGFDKVVRLWDAHTGAPGPILSGHTDHVVGVKYSPNGYQIASGSLDKTVRLWDAQTGVSGPTSSGHTKIVSSVTYSPGGHQIASGSRDKSVRLWDAQTGAPGPILIGHTNAVTSVTYSPSGHQIASGGFDKKVRLWNVNTGEPGPTLSGHRNIITSVAYSPSGHQIASGSWDRTVRLWDAQVFLPGFILSGHGDPVTSVVYSPSGHQIASGSYDKTVQLWGVQTGAPGPTLSGHTDIVTAVAYSPRGHQVASGSQDMTVRLWDIQAGASGPILSGHIDIVTSVAYSPNGLQIASGSEDKTVRLWDVDSGRCLVVVQDGTISSIACSASLSNIYFATGCDNSVHTWKVIEQEDRCQVRLHWRSIHDRLSLWNTSVQGARGLSNINTQLLRQRGAVI